MNRVTLTVNGETITTDVSPRTHLADFLREDCLLTGTHIGCEHGVCGACTLLIDGAPARSCIAFAVACDGCDIRTIEGLEDDPIIVRLRAAFSSEHALQCGYCTPGMLITARDIVQRLPNADEDRVRLELAGNLCRCTGYAGIVRAILRVACERFEAPHVTARPLPSFSPIEAPSPQVARRLEGATPIETKLHLQLPVSAVWEALHDPRLVAECIPGARVVEITGDRLRGEIRAALGPIETLFAGEGAIRFDDAQRCVEVSGEGRDNRSGTRLGGRATICLADSNGVATDVFMAMDYSMRGPLAQFARGDLVREFTADIAAAFAANFEARLSGRQPPPQPRMKAGTLILRIFWRRVRAVLGLR